MGKIRRRKLRSCKFCKPHKMGLADKKTAKERNEKTIAEREIKESTKNRGGEVR